MICLFFGDPSGVEIQSRIHSNSLIIFIHILMLLAQKNASLPKERHKQNKLLKIPIKALHLASHAYNQKTPPCPGGDCGPCPLCGTISELLHLRSYRDIHRQFKGQKFCWNRINRQLQKNISTIDPTLNAMALSSWNEIFKLICSFQRCSVWHSKVRLATNSEQTNLYGVNTTKTTAGYRWNSWSVYIIADVQ